MAKKKHELNDAAFRETKWIEPIQNIQPEHKDSVVKAKHPVKNKHVGMRENKQGHQHTFDHQHENRKTLPRGKID